MSRIDNLRGGDPFAAVWKAIRDLQTAANANSTAIGAGGIRVHSGGGITIENNGGLLVTGTAEVIGRLLATGIIDFMGEVNISGPLVVEDGGSVTIGSIEFQPDGSAKFGTLTIDPDGKITTGTAEINPDGSAKFGKFTIAVNGDLTSEGSLDIKGPATLNNDLTVAAGKKITLGGLSLENGGAGSATLNLPNGSLTASTALGLLLLHTTSITLASDIIKLDTLPTISGVTPNVYIDPTSKQLKRITP